MSKTKRIVIIILASLLVFTALSSVLVFVVLPVTFDYDETLIYKNPEYSARPVKNQKYITLTKDYLSVYDPFRVLVFSDMHLDMYAKEGNINAINMMIRNIVRERPDLVVFTGDNITGYLDMKRSNQFAQIFESLGVYWTCVLGNHEHDHWYSFTRQQQLECFAKYKHCLVDTSVKYTEDGEEVWGVGNHAIIIWDAFSMANRVLYFLDSGKVMTDEDWEKYSDEPVFLLDDIDESRRKDLFEYDYIKESQIKWLKETAYDIEMSWGFPIKSTVFTHVPVQEMAEAWVEFTGESYDVLDEYHEKDYDGLYKNYDGDGLLYGERREVVCHSAHNSGLFEACQEIGTEALLFGHDHINDCILRYKGIFMGYIKTGGYSTYNTLSKKYKASDGTEKSVEDHLTVGYTTLDYVFGNHIYIKSYENYDIYPGLNEKLVSELRKK